MKYLDKDGLLYLWNKIKDAFAFINSPALGAPNAPTPDISTNNTQIATAAYLLSKKSASESINKSDGLLVELRDIVDNVTITNTTSASSASVAKSGYTPIMIVGFRIRNATSGGAGSSSTWAYRLYLSGSTVYYSLRARDNITAKVRLSVYVLYRKN